ncbi:hypothetical protein THERMOS_1856 [Bathymodiolus thermophilus thioautotrophic gill symbiont]|uniref:Uncharacterized protein n=1 Tax=Bathymodiolus thermophilus thioautotrophic gill symbiont TaxID=2360 RepID=A0A8H9CGE0_9GAMM|nr:hypothetical protein THERMOS_1856 [Bathymodiolus thermophilus thioautotrophic gill symbiont]
MNCIQFLSRLCGGEFILMNGFKLTVFLSRLCGGELRYNSKHLCA